MRILFILIELCLRIILWAIKYYPKQISTSVLIGLDKSSAIRNLMDCQFAHPRGMNLVVGLH